MQTDGAREGAAVVHLDSATASELYSGSGVEVNRSFEILVLLVPAAKDHKTREQRRAGLGFLPGGGVYLFHIS